MIRQLNAMWMESICPICGSKYTWHRELRNRCPNGHDFGFIVSLKEFNNSNKRS